ncbi:hypothetical protein EG68_07102 [Paragonimus skrjabini miyazakii]|uniref:Uncharacterized protein n=1 Tax=Paragonimus skrjabini miyazakii TaxID=59628 RepID=A0A8S9YMD6_9TREM|nr:hypothetical protein EG68_07102 [Paragonimus skrjabini miyazakii]
MRTNVICSNLYNIWKTIIINLLNVYVIYRLLRCYMKMKDFVLSQRYGSEWNIYLWNLLLWSLILSILIQIVLLYSLLVKTGHLANDGGKLTSNNDFSSNMLEPTKLHPCKLFSRRNSQSFPHISLKSGLYSGFLYLSCSYLLLLPRAWITGEMIKNEAKSPVYLWHTDLDFLLPARPLLSILNQHAVLPIALNVDHNLAATSLFALQPPALGGLGQLPQTQAQMEAANRLRWQPELNLLRSTVDGAHAKTEILTEPTSVEFVNFLLAGMIFTAWLTAWVGFSSQQALLFRWQTHTCATDASFNNSAMLMENTIVRSHNDPAEMHQNRCLSTKNTTSLQKPDSFKVTLTADSHLCGLFPVSKLKRNGCFTPKQTMENKADLSNFEEPSQNSTFGSHADVIQHRRDIVCPLLTGTQSKNTTVDLSKCVSSIEGQLSEKSNITKSSAHIDTSLGLPYAQKYGCFGNSPGLDSTPSEFSQANASTNELKSFTDNAGLQFLVYTVDEVSLPPHHFYNGKTPNRDPKLLTGLEGHNGEKLDINFQHFNHGYSVSSDKVYTQPPINHARQYTTDSSGSSDSACNLNETHIGLSPLQSYQIQLAPLDTNYQTTEGQDSLGCRSPLIKSSVPCSTVSYVCVHDGQSYKADCHFSGNFEQFNHGTHGDSRFWKIGSRQSKQLSESISSNRAFENNLCSQV